MQLNENKLYSKFLGTLCEGSMRFASTNATYSILHPVVRPWKAQDINSAFSGFFAYHSLGTRSYKLGTTRSWRHRFPHATSRLRCQLEISGTEPTCSASSLFLKFWRIIRESHLIE